jgi:hypothetical protein
MASSGVAHRNDRRTALEQGWLLANHQPRLGVIPPRRSAPWKKSYRESYAFPPANPGETTPRDEWTELSLRGQVHERSGIKMKIVYSVTVYSVTVDSSKFF